MRHIFRFFLIGVLTSMQTAYAQVSITQSTFEGRESYTLKNSQMRITMLTGGAYIAELRLLSPEGTESVNPMLVPHYRTIDPHQYTPEKHQHLYGLGRNAKLMAGYMGHYLCFPYFGGGITEDEEELGYSTHGEAYTVKYEIEEKIQDAGASVTASATLPMSEYAVSRTLTLMSGQSVVLVEETIENLEDFKRPYHYVQHVTFGKPFIEFGKTLIDAPVTRIANSADKSDPANMNTLQWPMVSTTAGVQSNAGVFGSDKGEGLYRAWFMDPERAYTWFTMYNPDQNLLVGYIFSREQNPWIGDWQENQRSQVMPRSGKTVAWGLEVGTTPFGSGVSSIEQDPVFDTETYRLIGAKQSKKQSYLIFLLEIDKDFKGVGELKLEEGAITLVEKDHLNQIRIAHDFPLPK